MPELTLQIGDSPNPLGFKDGDIVHAMNDVQLLLRHTLIITDHRLIAGGFFKPLGSLAYARLRGLSKWKVEGISDTEQRVTNLITSDVHVKPARTKLYIQRRVAGGKKAMFGSQSNAVWFEGQRPISLARLGTLWTDHITPATGLVPADHLRREYNTPHLKGYLVIVTNDFSNARREWLEQQEMQEFDNTGLEPNDPEYRHPVMTRRRKRYIDWRNLPNISDEGIDNILNKRQRVAIRRSRIRDEASSVLERT